MNTTEEWRDIYHTSLGQQIPSNIYSTNTNGMLVGYRVPGGVIYKTVEDRTEMNNRYDGGDGGQYSDNRPAIAVAMVFVPFPMGLHEKLSGL